jgi:peptidyl-tRNA hydrolase, PTH1 family
MAEQIKAIIGLGNPGREYEATRHNAGFMVLDMMMDRLSRSSSGAAWAKKFQGQFHQGLFGFGGGSATNLYLLKPETFMNLSGQSVAELSRFYKVNASEILVVHDEVDLPFGTLRMKLGGGDGGHNGLKSIAKCLGNNGFYRLRVGVGKPDKAIAPDYTTAAWVLGKFMAQETAVLSDILKEAAEFSLEAVQKGMPAAQQRYHKS